MSSYNQLSTLNNICAKFAESERRLVNIDEPIWIFGLGSFAKDLHRILLKKGYKVRGFVQTKPDCLEYQGCPVTSFENIANSELASQLLIGIYNRAMPFDSLYLLAKERGFRDVFLPSQYYDQFSNELGWRYWLGASSIPVSIPQITQAYERLSDDISKATMLDILKFRLGLNDSFASFYHKEQQYFNELTLGALSNNEVNYVDGGAYDGDTYRYLDSLVTINRAYLFEPDPDNYHKLSVKCTSSPKVLCLPLALGSRYTLHSFKSNGGEGGAIQQSGDSHIASVSLDELLQGNEVNFIKLDVEGFEIEALKGASATIKRNRPILALSLYHKPEDLWEIPNYLMAHCDNYSFYIRQHYYNSFESVFYAIPN